MSLGALTFLSVIVAIYGTANEDDPGRIVGGQLAKIANRPYQVSLNFFNGSMYFGCGGSILNSRYILTAAHCVKNKKSVTIRAGSEDKNKGGKVVKSNKFIAHPDYNSKPHDNDVAIIDMGNNALQLNGRTIKAIKLANENFKVKIGTNVTVSGWGLTNPPSGQGVQMLREVSLPIVSNMICKRFFSSVTDNMLCAGFENGGKNSCMGDSGGPLVLSNSLVQVGVVSYGLEQCDSKAPAVYASVPALRSWIKKMTNV